MDQFVPGRRDYNCEEEDTDEPLNHRPPFAFPPPPSSPSSSSSARRAKQQMESTEDNRPSGSGGGGPSAPFVEKEHMFDKVVTPSDVGKLNRLVIPKQHAEKYFPLDASGGEKGLLLSFEDRTGKPWRFRYSYWNSSQSYVMTKGWSRFVKEKRLAAGDTVSFGRGVGEAVRHHLFIDWKRRPETPPAHPLLSHLPLPFHTTHHHLHRDPSSVMPLVVPWGRLVVPPPSSTVSAIAVYDRLWYGHNSAVSSNPYLYLRSAGNPSQVAVQLGIGSGGGEGGLAVPVVFDSVPAVQSNAAAKTVRLFGVNLGCSPSEADPGGDAAAHGRPPPPAQPPLPMRLGAPEVVESPGIGQQPVSLDLEM